ncbi:MAG: PEP-CTERM sorting domain-containing protein [Planctomycetota bacterium]
MTDGFFYSGGGSDAGLFGSPDFVTSTGFLFSPDGFVAADNVDDDTSVTTTDRLEVRITAKPGLTLDKITIEEQGDYSILGPGSVQVTGALFLTGPGLGSGVGDLLTTNPGMPITTVGSGLYDGMVMIDLPDGITEVVLVYNNTLQADSEGGAALIQKKTAGLEINVVIPEPATMGLLALGAPMLMRRRR